MKVTVIKTGTVRPGDRGLLEFLDANVKKLKDGSVVAITSKVAAILEGAVVPTKGTDKKKLVAREAEYLLDRPRRGAYDATITIKYGVLIANAGLDESNGGGWYVLWPRNPQRTVNAVRRHLMKKFRLRRLGVILTDSRLALLRWGTIGVCLAWSGFDPLKDYIGAKDLFGRKLAMTKAGVADGLAGAAVLAMGEGAERTPLAVIEDASFVRFKKSDPAPAELRNFRIKMQDDLFAPLLKGVRWKKGSSRTSPPGVPGRASRRRK